MKDKIVIAVDDVYEYELDDRSTREYLIRLIDLKCHITEKQIHADSFKYAYRYAEEMLIKGNYVRIISIEEVPDISAE